MNGNQTNNQQLNNKQVQPNSGQQNNQTTPKTLKTEFGKTNENAK